MNFEDFLNDLQFNRNYSENTLLAYKRDLEIYKEFCRQNRSLQEFNRFLAKKGLSARSQKRVISCVRSYLKFLNVQGLKAKSFQQMQSSRIPHKLPKVLSLKEFQNLVRVAGEGDHRLNLRNLLVLKFLYGLGCRVSELICMDVPDFNETESWVSVFGKGQKQRLLPLSKDLHQSLMLYLKEARPFLARPGEKSLFVNNRGNRPSRVDIWRWLKTWSMKAGFKEVKSPHSFRHGCATVLLEKGADLRSIQILLGHQNLQTTQIYTSVTSESLNQTIQTHHPLSEKNLKKESR